MAQQKNELRNLFKESVKPGNFNEGRDVQKLRISRIMFGSDGGIYSIMNHLAAQTIRLDAIWLSVLLCATIFVDGVKFLKRKIMLVQPADDIDRVLCFFSSRILFSIASSEDAIFSEVSFDGLYLGRDSFDRPYNLQDMGLPSIFIGLILICLIRRSFQREVNLASD
jgi:hypothetical protein